jgi:hypothetical protein
VSGVTGNLHVEILVSDLGLLKLHSAPSCGQRGRPRQSVPCCAGAWKQ